MFLNFGFEQREKELKLKKIENTNFKLYTFTFLGLQGKTSELL